MGTDDPLEQMTPERCPHLAGYEPLSAQQVRDPYPIWAKAQAEAPVFYDEHFAMWTVTRMDDVLSVIRDPATFSSAGLLPVLRLQLPEGLAARWPERMSEPPFLVSTDPPDHTARRKLMQRAFTPKHVASLKPFIRKTCEELIDELLRRGSGDLMGDFANRLTLEVITRVLGFAPEQGPQLRQWTEDFIVLSTADRSQRGDEEVDADTIERVERIIHVMDEALETIEARRRDPREDVITSLIQAADDEQLGLDDYALIILSLELALAGNDTTASLIGHTVYYLLDDRGQWDDLHANRDLIPNAVEEGLRRRGSSKGLFRRATKDVSLGEAQIREGDVLHVLFSAAGHDEKYFAEPRRFDIRRDNAKDHVSFGRWTHFCLGAPLARVETAIALEVLLDRAPDLRLVPDRGPDYLPSFVTHTLASLPVEVPARASATV